MFSKIRKKLEIYSLISITIHLNSGILWLMLVSFMMIALFVADGLVKRMFFSVLDRRCRLRSTVTKCGVGGRVLAALALYDWSGWRGLRVAVVDYKG